MPNLLRNPSFSGPIIRVALPFVSGAWASDWTLAWYYKPDDPILGTGSRWTLPEMIVQQFLKQVPETWLFYDDDGFVFHCFWNGSTGFGWKQTNTLPPNRYKFTCPFFPDQWHIVPLSKWNEIKLADPTQDTPQLRRLDGDGTSTMQVRPSRFTSDDWYLGSEVYVKMTSGGKVVSTDWLDARTVPYGKYTPVSIEIDHAGGELTVEWGCRGRWPFRSNGWFIDGLVLEAAGATVTPPVIPPVTPPPSNIPSDQLWAVRGALLQMKQDLDENKAVLIAQRAQQDALLQQELVNTVNAIEMVDHILAAIK